MSILDTSHDESLTPFVKPSMTQNNCAAMQMRRVITIRFISMSRTRKTSGLMVSSLMGCSAWLFLGSL